MKIKMRQFFSSVVIAAVMAVVMPLGTVTSYAATEGRIAFSDKTASVGSEVEINMKVTVSGNGALNNATVVLSYDSSTLQFINGTGASGGAGTVRISVGGDTADAKELSSTLKFKAIQAGASKISVNTQEVYDSENQVVNISQLGSSTITVQAPENASTEAALANLQVSPGTLTPAFSPDVFVYSASVDADVSKITVDAPAKDEKASVVLSGNEDLQPGENQVVCRVVAEDGATVKEYVITVTRAGGDAAGTEAPSGSIAVETPAKTVTIIPLDEGVTIPAGFAECTIKIDGQDVQGWIWATDTEHKYCVFYGMNEAGEKGFYRYDLAEKTMQRYFQDPAAETNVSMEDYAKLAEEHNSLLEDYKLRLYIIVGLGVAAALLLIIVIVLLSTRRRGGGDDEYTNYEEKLNDKREPIRRAAEGLPSQRARIQAERLEEEPAREPVREPARERVRETPRVEKPAVPEEEPVPASTQGPTKQTTFVPKPIVTVSAVQRTQRPPSPEPASQMEPVRQPAPQPQPQPAPQSRPQPKPQPQPAPQSRPQPKPQPVQPPTFGYQVDDDDDEFEVLDLD